MTTGGPFDAIGFQAFQPVEQRVVVREWRMDALHDLYALDDSNEIIGRVDAMNEHNACVTALRAALADRDQFKAGFEAATRTIEINSAQWADAARLREALVQAEACMSIVEPRSDKAEYLRILGVVRAALGQERGKPMSEWQPIETAPRDDGFLCLVGYRHKGQWVYRLASINAYGYDDAGMRHLGWRWLSFPAGGHIDPTHWQPLRSPPKPGE